MLHPRHSWILAMAPALAVVGSLITTVSAAADDPGIAFFEKGVRPLLETRCLKCHGGGEKVKSGLRLPSRDGMHKGGGLRPGIAPDERCRSPLPRANRYR